MVLKSYKDFIVGKGLLRTPLLKYNIFRRVQKSQSMHTSVNVTTTWVRQ